jgi:hypothetical protein
MLHQFHRVHQEEGSHKEQTAPNHGLDESSEESRMYPIVSAPLPTGTTGKHVEGCKKEREKQIPWARVIDADIDQ